MSARLGAILLSLVVVAAPRSASAQPGDPAVAAERFTTGEEAFEAGDFLRAAEAFEAAYAADPQPAALWNAARSFDRAGEHARAATLYQLYVREAPSDAPDRDEATRALVELGRRLGKIEIVAPSSPRLAVDGRPVRGSTVFVNAGTHLVEAEFGAARARREVSVEEGSTKTVLLEEPPATPSPAPPVPPVARTAPEPERRSGVTPWLMAPFLGTTALAGALTIASGVDTLVARGQYLDIPEDERTQRQYDDGKLKQDRTNVMIGVTAGLALVTTSVALFAIDWGKGTVIGVSPGGVRAHGWF
ncbi:MAG: tetratricopeptide repeat protein [Myxococcales bacterium]|nr:tetratricopeptide repeat protein [Myxococcales bacterium]